MTLTAAEQLMIELVNRSRLDPEGEAALHGIDLNKDLNPGTLDGTAKQVLAPNALLETAAHDHSQWMLDTDTFAHEGIGESSPHTRMETAGYVFTGSWTSGENIALSGTTGTINLNGAVVSQHAGLFKSSGHRENILNDAFAELGLAQVRGDYTDEDGDTFDTSMITQNFAKSGSSVFLTGVIYTDADNDNFYSIGEAVSGTNVSAQSLGTSSASAGGYALALSAGSSVAASIGGASFNVDLSTGNAKVDLVDGNRLFSSVDITVIAGVSEVRLLGVADIDATGSGIADVLVGNAGKNSLNGGDGHDTMQGNAGNDIFFGGDGADLQEGGAGNDNMRGETGNDTLLGGDGNDVMRGGNHRDMLEGGIGDDTLNGGKGKDRSEGQAGDDEINGGQGRDNILGGKGNDLLQGGSSHDRLSGGKDNDTLMGGSGDDTISGGTGADELVFNSGDEIDEFTDFENDIDQIRFDNNLWGGGMKTGEQIVQDHAEILNGNAVFTFSGGEVLTVIGVTNLSDFYDDVL